MFSPELESFTADLAQKHKLTFPILRDRATEVAQAFGLAFSLPEDLKQVYMSFGIDLAKRNGDNSWRLPMPARFVVDRTGIIRSVECDPDYTTRPEAEATVGALQRIAG